MDNDNAKIRMRFTVASMAAILGVVGALVVSANIGATPYGFMAMCLCNGLWIYEGKRTTQSALLWMNAAFLAINSLGVIRYW